MKNYADIYLLDELKRVSGVGDVQIFGSDYAMRVWLNPDKLAELKLTIADVTSAIKEQNVQAPAGEQRRQAQRAMPPAPHARRPGRWSHW